MLASSVALRRFPLHVIIYLMFSLLKYEVVNIFRGDLNDGSPLYTSGKLFL